MRGLLLPVAAICALNLVQYFAGPECAAAAALVGLAFCVGAYWAAGSDAGDRA